MTQVSLTTSTNYNGPLNALVEDEGTTLVIRFDLDEPAPAGGLKVYIDSELDESLNRLDLLANRVENINFGSLLQGFNGDNSGIAVEINEGATFATLTLPIFDTRNAANPFYKPEIFDGLNEVTYTLKTRDQVSAGDLPIIERNGKQVSDYTVNSSASSSLVYFADTASQLPMVTPTPTVSLSASPTNLVEEDSTLMTLTINLSEPPPEGGINVTIDSDVPRSLAQFDVGGATYNGAQLVAANSDVSGFTVRVTEQTATITLAVFDDAVDEGPQTITYALQAGDGYEIDSAASAISINIDDNDAPTEPTVSFNATPTTINEAEGTALVMNFSVDGDIPEGGITVNLEGDAARIMQQFTVAQTRFNDDGEIFYRFDNGFANNTNDNIVGGILNRFSLEDGDSSESASNPEAAGDAFLSNFSFTITEPTASITIPVIDDLFEEMDETYTCTIIDGDGYMVDSSANSATFTVTDGVVGGGGPTVGVSATPTMLVESEQTALTLTFTTEGDIPPEGVVVVLEGPPRAIAEFDVNATNPRLPESETVVTGPVVTGGSIVGTDETAGSIIFRITDPTATITVPVFQDEVEEGAENLTFNLRDGELYNVDSNANGVSLTINDVAEPVVSFSVNTTTLIEEEATLFTFSFSVNGVIPEGGLEVALGGELLPFIEQLDFSNFDFSNPDNVQGVTVGDFREDGSISLTLLEPSASLSVRVFDDVVKEADASFDLMLLEADGYSVNQEAKGATVTVTDGVIVDNPHNPPTVSLSVSDNSLTEGEEFTVNFSVDGDISEENPLTVLVNSTEVGALGEFNIFNEDGTPAYTTTGIQGQPTVGDDTGSSFLVELTDTEASITLPVFNDGIGEGTETFNFALVDGERYNVDGSSNTIALTIEETPVEVKFEANENGEVSKFAYDLTGAGDAAVTATVDQEALDITDAAFDNLVGFYQVVDENGGIDTNGDGVADFNPGDAGYAQAALENAVDGMALRLGGDSNDDTTAGSFGDSVIQGGTFYAPFAIANAGEMTVADFLAANPNNDAASSIDSQVAYFAFGEANPDGANHLKSWGDGIFGFEDLPDNLGVSDNDFNDAVFKFNFTV